MSDLQCAATFLLVPYGEVDALAPALAAARVAHVWTTTTAEVRAAAGRLADDLGVGVTERSELAVPSLLEPVLAELADEHRGETAVVVVDSGGAVVEVRVDGDGWSRRTYAPSSSE
jgi:hypothetical protein